MKSVIGFKKPALLLIVLLLLCIVFFVTCNVVIMNHPSNTQNPAITPIGAPTACLTVQSPSLVKLADGNYKLVDEIDNCGDKNAGPLKVTVQIGKETINLLGPTTIPANSKAMYNTFAGQTSETNKELHFSSPPASSVAPTILATINSSVQGEWDGNVTIPA